MSLDKIFHELGFSPKKSLGQRFLVDENIAERIAGLVPAGASVVEVGGGVGMLTGKLLERTRRLTVVEVDSKLARYLSHKFGQAEIIHADFLNLRLPQTDLIVSAVPYSISKRFVLKLLTEGERWRRALLILQKEFAEKICAMPCEKNYRGISVVAQAACRIELLEKISRKCFYPTPKVDSVLVRLSIKESFAQEQFLAVWKLAFRLFSHRNKTVRATLKKTGLLDESMGLSDSILESRVGCLDVEGVLRIAEALRVYGF